MNEAKMEVLRDVRELLQDMHEKLSEVRESLCTSRELCGYSELIDRVHGEVGGAIDEIDSDMWEDA